MVWRTLNAGAIVAITFLLTSAARARDGLLFDGNSVSNSADSSQRIRVGERLNTLQLKRRFPGYVVESVSGDCGGTCFNVSGPAVAKLKTSGGTGKNRFYLLTSDAPTAKDVLGTKIATSLRTAIGATSAHCDDGMATSCDSNRIRGLSYDVGDNSGCSFPLSRFHAT